VAIGLSRGPNETRIGIYSETLLILLHTCHWKLRTVPFTCRDTLHDRAFKLLAIRVRYYNPITKTFVFPTHELQQICGRPAPNTTVTTNFNLPTPPDSAATERRSRHHAVFFASHLLQLTDTPIRNGKCPANSGEDKGKGVGHILKGSVHKISRDAL
jgi:hypothetical protein